MKPLSSGDNAPAFSLVNQHNKKVSLADFAGKKVLVCFFPFAFSGVCSIEFGCFEKDLKQFTGEGYSVVGISVDSHYALNAFSKELGTNITFLSDFNKETCKAFGVLRPEGFAERAYFVIDNGKITFAQVMDTPGIRLENTELLEKLS